MHHANWDTSEHNQREEFTALMSPGWLYSLEMSKLHKTIASSLNKNSHHSNTYFPLVLVMLIGSYTHDKADIQQLLTGFQFLVLCRAPPGESDSEKAAVALFCDAGLDLPVTVSMGRAVKKKHSSTTFMRIGLEIYQ